MTTNIKRREMLALMSKTAAVGVLLPAFGYPQTLQARQGVVIGSVTAISVEILLPMVVTQSTE